jgi:hypothetical protein
LPEPYGLAAVRAAGQAGLDVPFGGMGKGYADGSAVEERFEELERRARGGAPEQPAERRAVFASTAALPERHFLGWLGDVDPDALFASGEAWGITVVARAVGPDGRPA